MKTNPLLQVDEPNEGETLQILRGLRERYERHHKCMYTDEAIQAAVRLSHKYIADRFMPDKVCGCVPKGPLGGGR